MAPALTGPKLGKLSRSDMPRTSAARMLVLLIICYISFSLLRLTLGNTEGCSLTQLVYQRRCSAIDPKPVERISPQSNFRKLSPRDPVFDQTAERPVILVTGGLGYIGSHTCVALLEAGYSVVVIDNLLNSKEAVKHQIEELSGKLITWYNVDLLKYDQVEQVVKSHNILAVIHFAGLKAVGESVAHPVRYYHQNMAATLNLVRALQEHSHCRRLVFSSSATVYGLPKQVPVPESITAGPIGENHTRLGALSSATNPYGATKVFQERVLEDLAEGDPAWAIVALRYFNPAGAHSSGCLGEDPNGVPANLMPYLVRVATGVFPTLHVFGTDYPTRDGTGVRDYIHVMDLAEGHVAAVRALLPSEGGAAGPRSPGYRVYNLGTGTGYTVLELVAALEAVIGRPIPLTLAPRRQGDIAETYADASRAGAELGWAARRGLGEMAADSWRFATGKCTHQREEGPAVVLQQRGEAGNTGHSAAESKAAQPSAGSMKQQSPPAKPRSKPAQRNTKYGELRNTRARSPNTRIRRRKKRET